MALNAHFRDVTDRVVVPVGRGMVRIGLTANSITLIGLIGTAIGMVGVLLGHPVLGGWIAAAATALDSLDGTVARLRGTTSRLGAFYDSVADRVADSALFGTAAWLAKDEPIVFALIIVAFAAALTTSYIRAKAESLGWSATVGLIERPERVIILLPAIGYGFLWLGAWVLAVGGVVTIVQRLIAVIPQARAADRAAAADAARVEGA